MTQAEELASFAMHASYNDISPAARQQLKIRILDALGCAIGALDALPVRLIRQQLADFGEQGRCTLIGGGRAAPDRAALYNSALVRYLDFNDSYLAKGETCHPSDNLGALLAAADYANSSGRDFLAALALAYQVQCRLSDEAPVRARGFDHTTQGAYALAAGISRVLGLDREKTTNAIGIAGTAFNALRVTRTGALSHWKGLAYPNLAFAVANSTFLAMRGVTGPREVFEGNKGFKEAIAGEFTLDWAHEDLERVTLTITKEYNAEIHSQSAIEAALELRQEAAIDPGEIERVDVDIFDVAYHIIGGGEEGNKTVVRTKEEADHSLQYLIAVALLDGQVMPEQYGLERIRAQDVQALLHKVSVRPSAGFSERFPQAMPCRLTIILQDGRILSKDKDDYHGFVTRSATWEETSRKFARLAAPYTDANLRREIIDMVSSLELSNVPDLMCHLMDVQAGFQRNGALHAAQQEQRRLAVLLERDQSDVRRLKEEARDVSI